MHTRGQGNGIYCERHLRCSIFCVPLIVYQLFKIIRSAFGMGFDRVSIIQNYSLCIRYGEERYSRRSQPYTACLTKSP